MSYCICLNLDANTASALLFGLEKKKKTFLHLTSCKTNTLKV